MTLHRIEFFIDTLSRDVRVVMIAEQHDGTRTPHALPGSPHTYEDCLELIASIARRYLESP
jgi:hypothetical protein